MLDLLAQLALELIPFPDGSPYWILVTAGVIICAAITALFYGWWFLFYRMVKRWLWDY